MDYKQLFYDDDNLEFNNITKYEDFCNKIIELHNEMKDKNLNYVEYTFKKTINGIENTFKIIWNRRHSGGPVSGMNIKNNIQLKNETLNKDDDIFIRGGLGEWPPDKVWTILDFGKHNANINGIVKMLNIAPPEPPPLSPPPPGTVQTQAEPAKKIKSMDPKVMSRVAMFENLKSETGGKKSKKKKPKKRRRSTKRRHTKRRKHTKRRRAGKMS